MNDLVKLAYVVGQLSTMLSILASRSSCPRFDYHHSQFFFRGKIVNVAEVNQERCLEESGQWFKNADQTLLVLAFAKLVLQKGS